VCYLANRIIPYTAVASVSYKSLLRLLEQSPASNIFIACLSFTAFTDSISTFASINNKATKINKVIKEMIEIFVYLQFIILCSFTSVLGCKDLLPYIGESNEITLRIIMMIPMFLFHPLVYYVYLPHVTASYRRLKREVSP
jgi:uncharacterized membrane protein (DUF485 family)